jgi:hypothetical protein
LESPEEAQPLPTRTVDEEFRVFHSRITPSSYESGKASSHKASITSRLERDFDLKALFYSGSVNNGTSISRHSDIDFFARIPSGKLKQNSGSTLREVKESLQDRFKSTHVYVDAPAVVLDFGSGDWDTADVIPADFIRSEDGKNVYEIPDGEGGWMTASPSIHTSYVTEENKRLNGKLKPLIRFPKAWTYYRDVPISSFYLELRVTRWTESETLVSYDIDVCSMLRRLDSCALASMVDPKGISGHVRACKTPAAQQDAISKLSTALRRASKAREAANNGNTEDAFWWWDLLFAGKFPSYRY